MSAIFRLVLVIAVVCGCVVCAASGQEQANDPQFSPLERFVMQDGDFVITAGGGDGRLASAVEYEPGQYVLVGEYKTEGMEAVGRFAADVKDVEGKVAMSGYDWSCASPQWSPFVMYVTVDQKRPIYLRLGNWRKCVAGESKVRLRNLKMYKQEWTDGNNLLIDGDFAHTAPGHIPANWSPRLDNEKSKAYTAEQFSVIIDEGDKAHGEHLLRMISPGDGGEMVLQSRSFNLPAMGDLELTFWAKADHPTVIRPRIVQSWTPPQYVNTPIALTSEWVQVSVNLRVMPDPKRLWFQLRLELPRDERATVEFGDLKLIWRKLHVGVDKPVAKPQPKPANGIASAPTPAAQDLPPFDPKNLPSVAKSPREYMVGLNIAGGEFMHKDPKYGWPSNKTLDYFQSKGFRLIRLPIAWERIQPVLGEELEPGYAAELVRIIDELGKRDMVVLLDLHNYAKYRGKGLAQGGFTYEQFGDVWERIAKLLKPQQKHIWGYGLMNEPHITGPEKIPFWQAGIDAIRKHDPKNRITVSGEALKGELNPKQFHLKDPARALVYESHFYFDHDGNGKYALTWEQEQARPNPRVNPMIGVERIKKFIEVCEKYKVDCMIGEFGVPAGDGVHTGWLEALENAMKYMHEHRITSTYWAAGDYWTRRGNSYVIGENGWKPGEHEGEDRPQVKILEKYIKLSNSR